MRGPSFTRKRTKDGTIGDFVLGRLDLCRATVDEELHAIHKAGIAGCQE